MEKKKGSKKKWKIKIKIKKELPCIEIANFDWIV